MALPTMKPDRRRTPRTSLAGLEYINFEPDNGGIVLNISEEGLCFHAVAPVPRGATLPFALSVKGNCVEAVGLLAWTDEHRKTGGLQFQGLAPEARRQIRTLIAQSSRPFAAPVAPQGPSKRLPNSVSAAGSVVTKTLLQRIRAPLRWGDFSRGLAAGLLIALFVAMGFSLDVRRQQIGGFLIRLGEHLAAAPQHEAAPNVASTAAPSAPSSPASATALLRVASVAAGPTVPAAPPSTPTTSSQRAEHPAPQPTITTQPHASSKLAAPTPASPLALPSATSLPLYSATPASALPPPAAADASQPDFAAAQPASSAPQPASPASPAAASHDSSVVAKAADQPGENANAEEVVEINSGIPLGKYFDVGQSKDEFAANQIERNLTDLGFRTIVHPQSLLWMKSYQVLVGPYRNTHDAEGARRSLESQGYKPRSLAQRSRQLTLVASRKNPHNVSEWDTDDFIVTWEAYSAQATVRFVKKGETSGTAVGEWVRLPSASEYSAVTYTTGHAGKRTLLSIQFHGMKQALMLPNSADRGIVF